MRRDFRVYLEDILGAITKIRRYTAGLSKEAFASDERTLDAVVRNLEVIGEAVKQLPSALRAREPGVEWQKIAGLRDILIHQYFGIDADILWDVITTACPCRRGRAGQGGSDPSFMTVKVMV
jgi:uncharacterized protein with HEPN domain